MSAVWVTVLALAGFAALSLGMRRHWDQVFRGRRRHGPVAGWLRAAGWASLCGATAIAVASWGWGLGTVALLGVLTPAALAVAMGLALAAGRHGPGRRR